MPTPVGPVASDTASAPDEPRDRPPSLRRVLRFYGTHLWSYRRWMLVALLAMPIYSAASVGLVALTGPLFADVLQVDAGVIDPAGSPRVRALPGLLDLKALADRAYLAARHAFGIDQRGALWFTPALMLVLFASRNVADFWSSYAFQCLGYGVTTDIRNDLHRRFLDQGQRFHGTHTSGALSSRVINDVSAMQAALSNRVFDLVQQSLTLVLLVALLVSTHTRLALGVLATVPLFAWVFVVAGRHVRRASRQVQDRMAEVGHRLGESLHGLAIVKAFGMEAFEQRRFEAATGRHRRENLRVQRVSLIVPLSLETLLAGAAMSLLVLAGQEIRRGTLTPPLVLQFVANLWLLYEPVRKLSRANLALQQAMAASDRVVALLDRPLDVGERPGAPDLPGFNDRIEFDAVTVRFGPHTVLDRVSLEIRKGEMVALAGPSGAGKTTLANLLLRFFDPDEGSVRVDGHDLREVSLASVRALTGLVTQHTQLFDDTIRNNIAYGRADLPQDRIAAAARAAVADDFIARQPLGYDTVIGEAGGRLSGGERQRLAVARALAKDPPVLVLDEATSQLDGEAAALVDRALRNLMAGRTVLVIAHRPDTVSRADRVVLLDGGRVTAAGRHEELMRCSSLYRRLFRHHTTAGETAVAAGAGGQETP